MKAHQIYLTKDNKIPKTLDPLFTKCCESFKKAYSFLEYKLYSGEEIEEIIKNNFDNQTYLSYKKLIPFAYRCDLARMCLLYLYGGIYSDLYMYHMLKINLQYFETFDFVGFRDRQICAFDDYWSNYSVSNTIMHIKKGSKIVENYIEIVIDNCKDENYGENCLDVTGPLAVGKAIYKTYFLNSESDFFRKNILLLGKFKDLTFGHKIRNLAFVSNEGYIIAVRKEKPLKSWNFLDGNEYNDLYHNKLIYNKEIIV